ncbi:MAG TPA: hypothetical protein VN774_06890 [Candidatus Limnocylindrales bacterium]|nr:hypothetical protein [Candidatus Limnocylindrales bacterium]
MRLPDSWIERLQFLEALEEEWQPIPRAAFVIWLIFYVFFLFDLAAGGDFPHYIDLVFIPVHEGGHLLFRWFGQFIAVAGGTFLQLAAPILLAIYFAIRRQAQAVAFCIFFFFEQFLPISIYMGDARAQQLPLLTVGDSEDVIHDWNYLFSKLGLLEHDTQIASATRVLGWLGMLATVAWLLRRGLVRRNSETTPARP